MHGGEQLLITESFAAYRSCQRPIGRADCLAYEEYTLLDKMIASNYSFFNETVRQTFYSPVCTVILIMCRANAVSETHAYSLVFGFRPSSLFLSLAQPHAVLEMSGTPRFGHSGDMVAIVGTKSELRDYVAGLIFGAALLFAIFLIWLITSFVFMCLGKKRVGWLAGGPFDGTPTPRTDLPPDTPRPRGGVEQWDDELEKEYHKMQYKSRIQPHWKDRPTLFRILFLCCGLVYIVFSILLITKGVGNIFRTVNVFQHSLARLDVIANDASRILNRLRPAAASSGNIYKGLSSEVSGANFCPNDPSKLACREECQGQGGNA
jgi:hypothetical protein